MKIGKFTVLLVLCLFSINTTAPTVQQKEVKKKLEARLNYRVHWNIDTEDENNTGSLNLTLQGLLIYNEEYSSLPHGMMTIMLPYNIQSMQGKYLYKERKTDKDPPDGCPELVAEYDDSGTLEVPHIMPTGDLMDHQLGSIGKITKMNAIAPPEVKDLLHDYYDFFLVSPDIEIHGRQVGKNCKGYVEATQNLQLCHMEIRFLRKENGDMSGDVSWSTHREGGSPPLYIKVSNLPEKMDDEPFSPPNEPGNVNYHLSWEIDEPSALLIQRKKNGKWHDIDSDEALKRVSVGERIELKGVGLTEEKKVSSPTWSIDGNNNQNYIKKYDANDKMARVIPLKNGDLKKEEVVFFWYKGETGKVKLSAKVGDTQYEKEVEFKISRPDYTVSWDNKPESRIDKIIDAQDVKDIWPPANWPPNPPKYTGTMAQAILTGLRYDGILFKCELKSDKPGETQWVQLVSGIQLTAEFGSWPQKIRQDKELDKVYPIARNESFFDAPGISIESAEDKGYQSWEEINDFYLYIMFRPKGKNKEETEKNEWVPIKLIKWSWGGKMRRETINGDWKITGSVVDNRMIKGTLEPYGKHEPTLQDTEEYPTWNSTKK